MSSDVFLLHLFFGRVCVELVLLLPEALLVLTFCFSQTVWWNARQFVDETAGAGGCSYSAVAPPSPHTLLGRWVSSVGTGAGLALLLLPHTLISLAVCAAPWCLCGLGRGLHIPAPFVWRWATLSPLQHEPPTVVFSLPGSHRPHSA